MFKWELPMDACIYFLLSIHVNFLGDNEYKVNRLTKSAGHNIFSAENEFTLGKQSIPFVHEIYWTRSESENQKACHQRGLRGINFTNHLLAGLPVYYYGNCNLILDITT